VLYSVRYRTQYAEFLKIDFPRVPFPQSAEAFQRLSQLGATLRKLHLLDGVTPAPDYAAFPVAGDNIIDKAEWRGQSVYINKTQYFENVPQEVWTFYIGGYQPAQKWLKNRRGRALDFDAIEHYQKIITALKLTLDIQAQIDDAMPDRAHIIPSEFT
jgi:predicted helicase